MLLLPPASFPSLYTRYCSADLFFPIIGSVLEGVQEGVVIGGDDAALVVHTFGFAQYIGRVEKELLSTPHQGFMLPEKIRLYDAPEGWPGVISQRVRMHLEHSPHEKDNPARTAALTDLEALRDVPLALGSRFWRSEGDFFQYAMPCVRMEGGAVASLCYAAAVSNGCAEIDVWTREDARGRSYGAQAARRFIAECLARGIKPLWDCYADNEASLQLARRLGFVEYRRYRFAVIPTEE